MRICRSVFLAAVCACAWTAEAQRASKASLRDSALVVTQETDSAAIALFGGFTNSVNAALTNDRASRASEDARVEGVASNLFLAAQAARHAGDTNLAAVLEVTRTNLLDHFTVLCAEERAARSTNVAAWGDAVFSDSRATNAVSRAIATNALGVAQAAIESNALTLAALNTNRVTRLQTPDGMQWQDATGAVWRVVTVTNYSITMCSGMIGAYGGLYGISPYAFPFQFSYEDSFGLEGAFVDGKAHVYNTAEAGPEWSSSGSDFPQTLVPAGGGATGTAVVSRVFSQAVAHVGNVAYASGEPLYPTNVISGLTWWDPGSNRWVTVTVSNHVFSVWGLE